MLVLFILLCVVHLAGCLWFITVTWQSRGVWWFLAVLFVPMASPLLAVLEPEVRKAFFLTLVLPVASLAYALANPQLQTDPTGLLARVTGDAPAPAKVEERQAAQLKKGEASPAIAATTCKVSSEPSGAEVLVDGKPSGQVTPAVLKVWAGRDTTVVVRLPGYVPATMVVYPNLNQDTERHVQLVPGAPATARSVPDGAEVLLDGNTVLEKTPGVIDGVAPGERELVFRKKGFADVVVAVTAKVGRPLALEATLQPEAWVEVKSFPAGARLFVDGRDTGAETPTKVVVSSGEQHVFEVRRERFLPSTSTLATLAAGELEHVTIPLDEATARSLKRRMVKVEDALRGLEAEKRKATAQLVVAQKKGRPDPAALERQLEELERALARVKKTLEAYRGQLARLPKEEPGE